MTLHRIAGILTLLVTAGCSSRQPELARMSADQLFARGETALAQRKWNDAIAAFERFALEFPTHPRAQEARYQLAQANFTKREYVTAAAEFGRLASDYPAGPWADDARFKVCESYARLSPKPQLDQQYTQSALEHCRSLETYYPTSEYVPRAQEIVNDLTNKLADKQYRAGEFYFKRGALDSAILYYEATLRDYATSDAAPNALLRLYQAYTQLGYKEEADTARARLLKDYPNSQAARSVSEPASAKS